MIRIAIVGAGGIGDAHIEAYLRENARAEIVALADIDVARAQAKVQKFGLQARVFPDHAALLDGVEFDLASICSPPSVHAALTVEMLRAGKHVLVEKPMANSLEECDRMIQAAAASGRLLSVVAQNRFRTPMQRVKKIVDAGLLGRIVHAQVNSFWWRGNNYYDLWWRGTWAEEGGGATLGHAVHQIDLLHWMMGMPQSVQSFVTNLAHTNSEVEDFSTAILSYPSGAVGQLNVSLVHHGEPQLLALQGACAMVSVPWAVKASMQRENGFPDDNPALAAEIEAYYASLPSVPAEGHPGQIANMLDAIEGRAELLIDGRAGRNTLELVTAIYASGFRGERVELPLPPSEPLYTRQGIVEHAPRFHHKSRSVRGFADEEIVVGSSSDQKR